MDSADGIKSVNREDALYDILRHLAARGWVSLNSMNTLMGYVSAQSVYARQKTSNPIPAVRVGGMYRVYETAALQVLQEFIDNPKTGAAHRAQAQLSLSLFHRIKQNGKMLRTS